jgi:outer membrane protein OmpA-like peptidoglycan-associated protein
MATVRTLLLPLAVWLLAAPVHGQEAWLRAGDVAYDEMAYDRAVQCYEKAATKGASDSSFALPLARSYMALRNLERATIWYERAVKAQSAKPQDLYHLSQTLRASGRLAEADQRLMEYDFLTGNDGRYARQRNAVGYVAELSVPQDPDRVVHNLEVNTSEQEIAPTYWKDKVVFARSRRQNGPEWNGYAWNGLGFLDFYQAAQDESGELRSVTPWTSVNTRWHESNATFSADGNTMFFTRNEPVPDQNKGSQRKAHLDILESRFAEGAWHLPTPFVHNLSGGSEGHPSLSSDGRFLFFTSDRAGGYGGTDIWFCERKEESWAAPVNLGPEVNTEGNEMFPVLHGEHTLYFSSDGHAGLGGLDMFFCLVQEGTPTNTPVNLGTPLNSPADDHGLVLEADGLHGYFASNRSGGKGNDDIYRLSQSTTLHPEMVVMGAVRKRSDNEALSYVTVSLFDAAGDEMGIFLTDPTGLFWFALDAGMQYRLHGVSDSYGEGEVAFSTPAAARDTSISIDLLLSGSAPQRLDLSVMNGGTNQPEAEVSVTVLDGPEGRVLGSNTTDEEGHARILLTVPAVDESKPFQLRLEKPGFISEEISVAPTFDASGMLLPFKLLDVQMDPIALGLDIAKALDLKPIYFDVAKWDIAEAAAMELDKIVRIMKEEPSMRIDLGSHTDSRGSASDNLALSQRRAQSSAAYITGKGIAPERLTAKGYGEKRLLNRCADGVDCSEVQHLLNRRTEFIIAGL